MPASFKTPHPANSKSWDQPLPNEAFIAVRRGCLNIHYSGGTVCALSACQRKSSRKHQVRPRQKPCPTAFSETSFPRRRGRPQTFLSTNRLPETLVANKQTGVAQTTHAFPAVQPIEHPSPKPEPRAWLAPHRNGKGRLKAHSAQPKPAIRFQTASALIQVPIALQCAPDCPKPPFSDGLSL